MKVEQFREIERRLSIPNYHTQALTEAADTGKNGVRRKKLYEAFKEWAKEQNPRNTFSRLFDPDVFKVTYPFVPDEMRYFYRWANPQLCVVNGLAFFQVSELAKLNDGINLDEMVIFAASETESIVFRKDDKTIYSGVIDEDDKLVLKDQIGPSFDEWLQDLVGKGDILNSDPEEPGVSSDL